MKLKDFLKQFEGLDPELEVGINRESRFDQFVDIEFNDIEKSSISSPFWYPIIQSQPLDENWIKIITIGYP